MITPNPALLWGAYTDPDPVTELADTAPSAELATRLEDLCAHLRALRAAGGTLTASRAVTDDAGLVDAAGALRTELIAELDRRRPGDEPGYVGGDTPHLGSRWPPTNSGSPWVRPG